MSVTQDLMGTVSVIYVPPKQSVLITFAQWAANNVWGFGVGWAHLRADTLEQIDGAMRFLQPGESGWPGDGNPGKSTNEAVYNFAITRKPVTYPSLIAVNTGCRTSNWNRAEKRPSHTLYNIFGGANEGTDIADIKIRIYVGSKLPTYK